VRDVGSSAAILIVLALAVVVILGFARALFRSVR
jgi:hypothetical protein